MYYQHLSTCLKCASLTLLWLHICFLKIFEIVFTIFQLLLRINGNEKRSPLPFINFPPKIATGYNTASCDSEFWEKLPLFSHPLIPWKHTMDWDQTTRAEVLFLMLAHHWSLISIHKDTQTSVSHLMLHWFFADVFFEDTSGRIDTTLLQMSLFQTKKDTHVKNNQWMKAMDTQRESVTGQQTKTKHGNNAMNHPMWCLIVKWHLNPGVNKFTWGIEFYTPYVNGGILLKFN